MAGVSALLKSASSTQAKIQSANDAEIAFEWSNSAQTYDDYLAYQDYLNTSRAKTTDPTKLLSYDTKLRDAFSGYSSNEIQRQGQAIMEGNQTTQGKMQVVESLYNQAAALGDANLSQNLAGTWDSLSVQLQNEAKAAVTASASSSAAATTAFKAMVDDTVQGYQDLQDTVAQAYQGASNAGEWQQSIAKINSQLPANQQLDPSVGFFDIAASIANAIVGTDPNNPGILQQAINSSPDAATANTYSKTLNKYLDGTTPVLTLPGAPDKTGAATSLSLTVQDIQRQIAAAQVGQTIYAPQKGVNGTVWKTNVLDNYTFGRDANGNTVAVPTFNSNGISAAKTIATNSDGQPIYTADKNGKATTKQATYTQLLENAGFNVTDNGNSLTVSDASGQNRLNGTNEANAYIDKSGQLQFTDNENNIYGVNFDKNGKFVDTGKQVPNPFVTAAGSGQLNENSPYFAAHPDQYYEAYNTAGILTPQTMAQFDTNVGIGNNPTLSGGGLGSSPPRFSNPTTVLQNAATVQGANQARLASIQAAAAPPQLISAPALQLQAPALNPQNINSSHSISIKPPSAPQPTISITPQTGGGKFLGVSTKPNTSTISF